MVAMENNYGCYTKFNSFWKFFVKKIIDIQRH